jgi:hypothetical protein
MRVIPHTGQDPGLSKASLSQSWPQGGQMYVTGAAAGVGELRRGVGYPAPAMTTGGRKSVAAGTSAAIEATKERRLTGAHI